MGKSHPIQGFPKTTVTKETNTFELLSITGTSYFFPGMVSALDASVHNRKMLVTRKCRIKNLRVNARSASIPSGDSVVVAIYDNITQTALKLTFDDSYTQDNIVTNSTDVVEIAANSYLSIGIVVTAATTLTWRFVHISFDIEYLE